MSPDPDGGVKRRDGSRLEIDDPEHCKRCGAEIPSGGDTDAQGRPMSWIEGDWVTLELCHDCWARDHVEKLQSECMERYNGELAGVLADE